MTWPEVERRIGDKALAVLPIGAGAKEHGRHLVMATDQIQAEWFAARLAERHDLLIWPTINYGYYPAFVDYPGSCSISEDVFYRLVAQTVAGICAHGAQPVCLLNSGISTIPALEKVAAGHPAVLLNIYDGPRCRAVSEVLIEQPCGGHADERETSIMLALRADTVDMTRAERAISPRIGPGALQRCDAGQANYSPSGVIGDATAATVAKGRQIADAILADLSEVIATFAGAP